MYRTESYTQICPITLHTPKQVFQAAENAQWKAVFFALVSTRFKPAVMPVNLTFNEKTLLDFAYENATDEVIDDLKHFGAKTFLQIQQEKCSPDYDVIIKTIDGLGLNSLEPSYSEFSNKCNTHSVKSEDDLSERVATLQFSTASLCSTKRTGEQVKRELYSQPSFINHSYQTGEQVSEPNTAGAKLTY